jgi:3-isopropylmalate/(R)-2-methylmalate dehydratase small subunit
MKPVDVITGTMAPLPRANVDTDQIIPKQFLKRVERSGFGPYLFYDWAYDAENEPIPDFVLNRPEYADATVLVAGPNFGCGSSREHAPWSIEDRGFEAIIAPSFADIFYNNCINIGLLPVTLTPDAVDELLRAAERQAVVTIDLEAQTVTCDDREFHFDIDAFARHRLREGLDQVGLTLQHQDAITQYETGRAPHKPSLSR